MGRPITRFGLDHPMLLAAAPALGYLVAYLDRLGEALVYGIPADYIQISPTDALSRTSLVVLGALMLRGTAWLKFYLEKRLPPWLALAVDTGTNWLLFAGLALVLAGNPRFALAVFGLGLFYVVVDTTIGFWRRHKLEGEQKVAGKEDREPVETPEGPTPSVRASLLVALSVAMLVLSFYGGNMRATSKHRYLVTQQDPNVVLLTIYGGNRGVLGAIHEGTSELTDARQLVEIPGEHDRYLWRETGPLSWRRAVSLMPGLELFK